jgi:hypothetical protein
VALSDEQLMTLDQWLICLLMTLTRPLPGRMNRAMTRRWRTACARARLPRFSGKST